jgi:hypothetical protein
MRRREFFRIHKARMIHNRVTKTFSFHIAYEAAAELTPRTVAVAEAFGFDIEGSIHHLRLRTEVVVEKRKLSCSTTSNCFFVAVCQLFPHPGSNLRSSLAFDAKTQQPINLCLRSRNTFGYVITLSSQLPSASRGRIQRRGSGCET